MSRRERQQFLTYLVTRYHAECHDLSQNESLGIRKFVNWLLDAMEPTDGREPLSMKALTHGLDYQDWEYDYDHPEI